MKRLINALAIVMLVSVMAYAQEYKSDTAKLSIGFVNISDIGPDDIQGVNGQAQIKLFRVGSIVQVDAAGDYAGFFPGVGSFHTFQAGPRMGVNLKKVYLFAGPQFGVVTDFDGYTPYVYMIGGGADYNVSKYVAIRGEYNRQFLPDVDESFNRFGVGIVFRIK